MNVRNFRNLCVEKKKKTDVSERKVRKAEVLESDTTTFFRDIEIDAFQSTSSRESTTPPDYNLLRLYCYI